MGQKNNAICNYLSDPAIFADFINGSIHHGQKALLPHLLLDRNVVSHTKEEPFANSRQIPKYIERQRDTLKAVCNNNHFLIIGIEAQDKVNYTIPLRCMEYDVIEYKRQLKELGKRREKSLTEAEFLSGISKDQKLNPVITIVFYHGKDPYDGCTNLHDMLELNEENQTYKRFTTDYHMNLVRPEDLDETVFETGLHELIGFLKYQNNKQELIKFVDQDKERIENMNEETFDAISAILSLPKKIIKQKKHTEGDDYNMCQAMKEWIADERNAGIKEGERMGIEQGIREGESRFVSLTAILLASQRLDDLNKAISDEFFRNSLYKEYAL